MAKAPMVGDLHVLRTTPEPASESVAISPTVDQKDILLWRRRLSHLSLPAIKQIVSQDVATGIDIHKKSPDNCVYGASMMGKLSRNPFKSLDRTGKRMRPLKLIHSDVMGPTLTASFAGKRYAIFFTDDATRFTRVYFMKAQSDAPEQFREYRAEAEEQLDRSIKRIRVDGGGEYSSAEFIAYPANNGIIKETTAPCSSQHNGVSERRNGTVADPARSMLKAAGMPSIFSAEAVNTAVFLKNLVPTRALPKGTTPFEKWFGTGKPNLKNFRTFGCLAYAWNPNTTARKKFGDRATKTVPISYGATGSHYKLYDIARKRFFISRDIRFDETQRYADILGDSHTTQTVATEPGEDEDSSDDEVDTPSNRSEPQPASPSRSKSSPLSTPPRSPTPQAPRSPHMGGS